MILFTFLTGQGEKESQSFPASKCQQSFQARESINILLFEHWLDSQLLIGFASVIYSLSFMGQKIRKFRLSSPNPTRRCQGTLTCSGIQEQTRGPRDCNCHEDPEKPRFLYLSVCLFSFSLCRIPALTLNNFAPFCKFDSHVQ